MKRLVIAALAASSLAGGAVLAQSAQENSNAQQFSVPHPERGGYIYGNSGWTPDQVYGGSQNYPSYLGNQLPNIIAGSGALVLPQAVPQYQPSRGDRDGDGVRNRADRYPDNPRYR